MPEGAELTDTPRFVVTDTLHGESGRILETWSFGWAAELFEEFGKQQTALEAAQVGKEDWVKRPLRSSCLARGCTAR